MLDGLRGDFEEHVAPLLRDIVEDTQKLLRQEFALAKFEVREDAQRMRALIAYAFAGAVAIGVAAGLMGVALALMLATFLSGLELWAAFAAVALLSALAGVLLVRVVGIKSRSLRLFPDQTLSSLREDARWIQERATM